MKISAMPTHHVCHRHPDREGRYYCQKYDRYVCLECIHCKDPKLYCKFRKMCMIWELERHGLPPELRAEAKALGGRENPASEE